MRLKRLMPWLAAGIAAIVLFLLYRNLRRYDAGEVVATLRAASPGRIGSAILFAAASYATLTLFDTLAVRYVGRRLPYLKIARTSFTSLAIGHNIGLAALSSGAIRYRFYARWGLTAADIAKIILFCAATVGLGLLTLGGVAWVVFPTFAVDITGLPKSAALAVGVACLGLSAAWIVASAVVRHPLKIGRWAIALPAPPLAAAQVAVGTLNFGFVAACLHQALLTTADVDYVTVAAVYVIGNVAALISHVPGGLGVIEGVVMYLLPQANLLAAVLVFRVVYFLLPLPLGGLSFLIGELQARHARGRTRSMARAEKEVGSCRDLVGRPTTPMR